ncbi:hypothetical protein L21SP3_00720 [Sedimentisphaera cyanobacteriorum]|uniref:Uncharacterized protein n=1 Tax=Sedimentisphaera cyanobacteriorum TaxID=1940790 RepID=A0A1Q2HN65_9BACT|nr:hypothetical protein [Sedimentisphaera cyanobacteriorum]AQQ08927.1 hypothetical protein L21SP3_00720 [Sedimentisphaera cyanobacteriorum]
MKIRLTVLIAVIFSFVSYNNLQAADRFDNPRRRAVPERRNIDRDVSREQRINELKNKAQTAHQEIKQLVSELAGLAADSKKIDKKKKREIRMKLIAGKKYSRYMSNEHKSDLYVADAWYGYLEGEKPERCRKKAISACKLSPGSELAYKSLTVFSLIALEEPIDREYFLKRIDEEQLDSVSSYDIPIKLDYDKNIFKLRGRNISELGLGGDIVPKGNMKPLNCIFVWSAGKYELTQAQKTYSENDKLLSDIISQRNVEENKIAKNLKYFLNLKDMNKDLPAVKFLSVNVDKDRSRADQMLKETDAKLKDTVFVSEPKKEDEQLEELPEVLGAWANALDMAVLVCDSSGSIKYAGPEFGVVFRLLSDRLMGGITHPDSLAGLAGIGEDASEDPFGGDRFDPFAQPQQQNTGQQQNEQPADPNSPAKAQSNGLTETEEYKAKRLLKKAEMLRGSYTRLGSSKKLIEACREVIETYPGTKYAKKAREIYESIPKHQRDRRDPIK